MISDGKLAALAMTFVLVGFLSIVSAHVAGFGRLGRFLASISLVCFFGAACCGIYAAWMHS